jgi:mitochondrial fission protein ELM1
MRIGGGLTRPPAAPTSRAMQSWILAEAYAGLQAQALGLAEAAGLAPELHVLTPRAPWRWLPAAWWPAPLAAVRLPRTAPPLVIGCGGKAAAVGAALRRPGTAVVQVQHPRMPIGKFDLVVASRHDRLSGPNVIVTRTALHRVTPARLEAARTEWAPRLAHLPRPLVAVLLGGSNGRFRLDATVGAALAQSLAAMVRADRVGLAITPSRRTDPAVTRGLVDTLGPLGAWVWDGTGDNPYFGLLALADAVIATEDSVSMISEAVATPAPVMVARLPGGSRRIGLFLQGLLDDGRVRNFAGRLETWPVAPLNDTPEAAAEMRRRLGF